MVWRFSRKQRISVRRLWISPIVLTVVAVFSIIETQQNFPEKPLMLGIALIAGAILGAPLGYLRGEHTTVTPTDQPGTMMLGPSWVVPTIWLGAFLARSIVRAIVGFSAPGIALGDGFLAFAVSALIVSYIAIYRKYQNEIATTPT